MISDADYQKVIDLALASAKFKGLGVGKGGHFMLRCPLCSNTIKVDVDQFNGHVRGKCASNTCVHWIQ